MRGQRRARRLPSWWDEKNARRVELIEKKVFRGPLTEDEASELKAITVTMTPIVQRMSRFNWERLNADRAFLGILPDGPHSEEMP